MSFDFAIINNDLKRTTDGGVLTVSDTQKLRQDILKIIITTLGSNKFHPWYGCTITEDVIGKNLPENLLKTEIQSSVVASLDNLQKLQSEQLTTQKVSLAEIINFIGSVIAYRSPDDPREVKVDVSVYSRRLTEVNESFTITP